MKKGFTLIELLAVIVILAIIALIATPLILNVIDDSKKGAFKNTAYGIIEAGELSYVDEVLKGNKEEITYTYEDGVESSEPSGKKLEYKGTKPQDGIVKINKDSKIAIAIHDGKFCAKKGYYETEVNITTEEKDDCQIPYYADNSGANIPELVDGMIPVTWDGSKWVKAEQISKWYDYDKKEWANVVTVTNETRSYYMSAAVGTEIPMSAINTMWVWIPRYIYKISNGWNSSTVGTIEVRFSKGIDDTIGNTVQIIDTGKATDSNGTWTNHPAFWWDNDNDGIREVNEELKGIWVAKFEPTTVEPIANPGYTGATCQAADNNPNRTVKIIPNANSWRCMTPSIAFTVSRNMETKNVYGWGVASGLTSSGTFTNDNNNLDIHMMKNVEWGAVTYLTHSIYGKNDKIWINPADNFTTGCSGDSVDSTPTSGCLYSYETVKGQNASTTGNIYGIYDISGGAWAYIAAYVDNGHDRLQTYGDNILKASSKYKDVYAKSSIADSYEENFKLAINKKGDAVYETSPDGNGFNTWYGEYGYMPHTDYPWFGRGCMFTFYEVAGSFAYSAYTGKEVSYNNFIPVLIVGEGF